MLIIIMNQPITRAMHGIADYAYAPLVYAAPNLAGFTHIKAATQLCRIIGVSTLASTVMTRAEWGLVRVIPFKTHLLLDVGVSVLSLAAPFLFHFAGSKKARNTFLLMGAVGAIVTSLTQRKELPL